jgi:hypothetical protein
MATKYICLAPCKKAFITEGRLRQHYRNRSSCKERWEAHYKRVEERNATILRERILQSSTQSINTDAPHEASANGRPVDDSRPSSLPEEQENWDIDGGYLPERPPGPNNDEEGGAPLVEGVSDVDMYASDDVDMVPMDLEYAFGGAVDIQEGGDFGPVSVEGNPVLPNDPNASIQDLLHEENYNPYRDADQTDESENEELNDFQPPELDTPEPISIPETVEINTDEDGDADPSCVDVFPRAGEVTERRRPRYAENVHHHMNNATRSIYHPFRDFQEFDLAVWLNQLPLSKVDSFLQLSWVSSNSRVFTRP